jgi:hypothetical protein
MANSSEIAKGLLLIKATVDELLAKLESEISFDYDAEFQRKLQNIPREWIDGGKAGMEGP